MRWLLLFFALLFISPADVSAQAVVRKSDMTVMLDNQLFYLHTVRRKETLYSIANAYGVTVAQITKRNLYAESGLKTGQTLLIPTTQNDTPTQRAVTPAPTPDKQSQNSFVEPKRDVVPLPSSSGEYDLGEYDDQGVEADGQDVDSTAESVIFGLTKPINPARPIKIVMMMPFGGDRNESNFVDFFRGASLAFDQIVADGGNILVDVISTSASPSVVEQIIADGRLADADMIIGPVYGEVFAPVAAYAAAHRVPIISPLGSTGTTDNAMVIEVAPDPASRWDKLKPLLSDPLNNVILITSPTATDTAALLQIEPLLSSTVQRIEYEGKLTSVNLISGSLRRDAKNVIVAPLTDESLVENLLSRYSSVNVGNRSNIVVVGTSRWARFSNMNLELFFKLSVQYPTTYFFDRVSEGVGQFYSQYVGRYSSLPTLYSLRGYDVMMIFGRAIVRDRERMFYSITEGSQTILQVPYTFTQKGDQSSKIINTDWALVQYLPSYRIEVK